MAVVLSQSGLTIETSTTGSGTGNYESFLRLGANDSEAGYNTDVNGQLDDKAGPWTHSLLVSDLQAVGGFYEIRLDLNEIQSGSHPDITMTEFQLWVGPAAGAGAATTFTGLTNKFDMTGTLLLHDTNHGSGTDDYKILIPTSMLTGGTYVTLYATFSGSDDGFEEFRALTNPETFTPLPDIGISKETEGTDDECLNLITGGTVHWTYSVENNGNVPLHNVVVTDDAGTPGGNDGPGGDPLDDDDFHPAPVLVGGFNIGDTNQDNILDTTETWQYTASGTVHAGEYENTATVSGVYADGTLSGQTVTGIGDDCYNGVTPTIQVVKYANDEDTDCKNILVGKDVVYTYEVTNTSPDGITIDQITIKDDNATVGTGDDFNPTAVLDSGHNIGDTHNIGVLDNDETWLYTYTVAAAAGEHENTVTVNGTAHDSAETPNTAPVTDSDGACYFGADPKIEVTKYTNGTNNDCPVLHIGEAVNWTYFVENTGNVALDNLQIYDDGGTPDLLPGDELDDFIPLPVLSGGFNVGDTANKGVFDPGEIWQFSASGLAADGHYDNVAYVSGDYTDDFANPITVYDDESDCYVGVEGPGVRTPGFWSNPKNGGQFWDGIGGNEKHAGEDCFPLGELLYQVDKNGDNIKDSTKGLLIGDWDGNGLTGAGEDTIFISLDAAKLLINASLKDQQDGRWVVGRDLVATWLNYIAGNPIGGLPDSSDGVYTPADAIQDAIDFLQTYGDTAHDGILATSNGKSIIWEGTAVKQGSAAWNNPGSHIHTSLDDYNNTGEIDGIGYAHTCDVDQFVVNMNGFMTDHGLFMM